MTKKQIDEIVKSVIDEQQKNRRNILDEDEKVIDLKLNELKNEFISSFDKKLKDFKTELRNEWDIVVSTVNNLQTEVYNTKSLAEKTYFAIKGNGVKGVSDRINECEEHLEKLKEDIEKDKEKKADKKDEDVKSKRSFKAIIISSVLGSTVLTTLINVLYNIIFNGGTTQ